MLWVGRGSREECIHNDCVLICSPGVTKLRSLSSRPASALCLVSLGWGSATTLVLGNWLPRRLCRWGILGGTEGCSFLATSCSCEGHPGDILQHGNSNPYRDSHRVQSADLASSPSLRDPSRGQPPPVSEGWSSTLGGFSSKHPD